MWDMSNIMLFSSFNRCLPFQSSSSPADESWRMNSWFSKTWPQISCHDIDLHPKTPHEFTCRTELKSFQFFTCGKSFPQTYICFVYMFFSRSIDVELVEMKGFSQFFGGWRSYSPHFGFELRAVPSIGSLCSEDHMFWLVVEPTHKHIWVATT